MSISSMLISMFQANTAEWSPSTQISKNLKLVFSAGRCDAPWHGRCPPERQEALQKAVDKLEAQFLSSGIASDAGWNAYFSTVMAFGLTMLGRLAEARAYIYRAGDLLDSDDYAQLWLLARRLEICEGDGDELGVEIVLRRLLLNEQFEKIARALKGQILAHQQNTAGLQIPQIKDCYLSRIYKILLSSADAILENEFHLENALQLLNNLQTADYSIPPALAALKRSFEEALSLQEELTGKVRRTPFQQQTAAMLASSSPECKCTERSTCFICADID
ncbi:MAG: hypothetical protein K2X27_23660 [Candidatus Obscuribacterales bacterium]|nr:hypothetical protein [Candidatus Obscuribacterales bacterium]